MKNPATIFRIAKLRTQGNLAGAFSHIVRSRPTENADPERTHLNVTFIGDKSRDICEVWKEKIESEGVDVRKNAVNAVEILISASPEYFRPDDPSKAGTYDKQRLQAWFEVQKKFIAEHFPHAIYAELQLDETTPHISVIDVPILKKANKTVLDTRSKYGGNDRVSGLAGWQDKAADAVKHLGIVRGVHKSTAEHVSIKEYYAHVNEPVETIPPAKALPKALPERTLNEKIPLTKANEQRQVKEEQHAKAVRTAKQHNAKRAKKAVEIVEKVQDKAKHADLAQRKAEEATETARALANDLKKAQANEMRAMPVGDVIVKLYGGTLKRESKETDTAKKYDIDGREIAVTRTDSGDLWIFQGEQKGGKNAINFVMECSGVDFKTALQMLAEVYSADKIARDVAQRSYEKALADAKAFKAMPAPIPSHDPAKQPTVEKYLNEVRKIPRKLIGHLFATGRLIADSFGNAVFPRFKGGAFKRGTRSKFYQTVGGKSSGAYVLAGSSNRTVFTESPIDALTLKAIEPQSTIIALGGNLLKVEDVKEHGQGKEVVLAFDNDEQGKVFTKKFLQAFPKAETLKLPAGAKDWNEALQKGLVNAHSSVADPLLTPTSKPQQNSIASVLRKPATP